MLLVKAPVPVPSEVWLSAVVGLADVLQQAPLTVTDAPPSDVTFPPVWAVVDVMDDGVVVVTGGAVEGVIATPITPAHPVIQFGSGMVPSRFARPMVLPP